MILVACERLATVKKYAGGRGMAKQRLGEVLEKKGIVTSEQLAQALHLQVGGNRRLGYILIKMGLLSSDQLIDALSDQLDVPIVDIADKFSDKVRDVVPRYLCHRYSAIPLCLEKNNVLNLAMLDPLDDEAVSDIENYTGKAVKPILARQKDISDSINRCIPFSLKDIFNPQVFGRAAKIASVVALFLVVVTGYFIQRYIYIEKYGSVSVVGDSKVFKNHDIMVGFKSGGKVSLLGHGAYTEGYYSVTFDDLDSLKAFVAHKKKNFSDKQYNWIQWVAEEKQQTRG